MKNRDLVYILFASLVGMIIGFVMWLLQQTSYGFLPAASQNLFFLSGVYLLVKNGTFIRTREYRFLGVSLAVLLVGAMLKVMHWEGGHLMLTVGLAAILFTYLTHFIRKPRKDVVDTGKLAFLVFFLAGKYFKLMHWPKAEELSFLSLVVLILVVVYFVPTILYK